MGSDRLNSLWEIMKSLWVGAALAEGRIFNEIMKWIDVRAFSVYSYNLVQHAHHKSWIICNHFNLGSMEFSMTLNKIFASLIYWNCVTLFHNDPKTASWKFSNFRHFINFILIFMPSNGRLVLRLPYFFWYDKSNRDKKKIYRYRSGFYCFIIYTIINLTSTPWPLLTLSSLAVENGNRL